MESRKLIDVSSYFLFEASGDSDQLEPDPSMAVIGHGIDVDKDDAESCCDLSDYVLQVNELDGFDGQVCDDYCGAEQDEDEDKDGNDQTWTSKPAGLQSRAFGLVSVDRKSGVYVDSDEGDGNEKEKSRLFWETCLAS